MTAAALVYEVRRALSVARCADYLELTKPRIAVLVLLTVLVGSFAAAAGVPLAWPVLHALIGTALTAGGASVFNHVLERRLDALMPRTANRPIPSGRVGVSEAIILGTALFLGGVCWLALAVNATTAVLGAASWFLYVCVYTPLKSRTVWNTAIGAVPGALPVVMGWTAVSGEIGTGGLLLFAVVFLWQFPHFMAIAWLYRKEYSSVGMKMLPATESSHCWTAVTAVVGAAVLLPASLALVGVFPELGWKYLAAAAILGAMFLGFAVAFARRATDASARALLTASLAYLPALFAALTLDLLT
ncbi:MAG: heme o synthase [Planctomycetales bacterium]